jgi:hypothetical protein
VAIYGVTVGDIAAELVSVLPAGISAATKPTAAQVQTWIDIADAMIELTVRDVTGTTPAVTDKAVGFAKEYIINYVAARVMRVLYVGRGADQIQAASGGYFASAKALMDAIIALGSQAVGTGDASPRLKVPTGLPVRELIVCDDELDGDNAFRRRRF